MSDLPFCGEVPEWSKGLGCKPNGAAFGGSNPPLSTIYFLKASGAGIAQLVEHQPSKLRVAGSSPVSRSKFEITSPRSSVGRALPW